MSERRLRDDALAIWRAGVEAVHAGRLVRRSLWVERDHVLIPPQSQSAEAAERWNRVRITDRRIPLAGIGRIAVVGAGKATTAMASAVEYVFGPLLLRDKRFAGCVNVPDATVASLGRIEVHGARKLPDNRPTAEGVEGSRRILEIARSLGEDDLLIVLLSGGGSALLPLPVDGVSLEDKLRVTALLQEAGAPIRVLNCIRKHLSQIKGGRLAEACKARIVTLIVSDVTDDALDVIASGPTAPDPTTYSQALAMLGEFGVRGAVPASVLSHLQAGAEGRVAETPKRVSPRVVNVVIGNNETARRAAELEAETRGYLGAFHGTGLIAEGDTQERARELVKAIGVVRRISPRSACLVRGGETTVALPAEHGKGGRNQEYALTILDALGADRLGGICVVCGGTDGEDGPTDAAGAFIDEELAREALRLGLDPADFLRRHDAYNFFDPLGGRIRTGPTNTNVMDLRVVLIDRTEGAAVPALAKLKERRTSTGIDI